MSIPGETHAGSSGGDTRPEPRLRQVDTGAGRIPPQTTVTGAAQRSALPVIGGAEERARLNGSVGSPAAGVRPAPVAATREATPPAHAGVVTRLMAAAVDAAAVVVLAALLDLGAAGVRFVWSPVDFRWPRPTAVVTVAVLLGVAVVYLAAGWALSGRTYGSRLMGLRVLSSRHVLLGWTRSVLRALVCVLWPVGLLWCGISRARLSLADVVLRTVVVYDVQPYAPARYGEPPGRPEPTS